MQTRIIRYSEDGKMYDGFFVEQSRVEVTKSDIIKEALVNEGMDEAQAQQVSEILKASELT